MWRNSRQIICIALCSSMASSFSRNKYLLMENWEWFWPYSRKGACFHGAVLETCIRMITAVSWLRPSCHRVFCKIMCHLWWPKWQRDWFLPDYFWCPCQYHATAPVSILPPHLSVYCHRTCQYLTTAPVSILPPHLSVSYHRTCQYLATAPVSILPLVLHSR